MVITICALAAVYTVGCIAVGMGLQQIIFEKKRKKHEAETIPVAYIKGEITRLEERAAEVRRVEQRSVSIAALRADNYKVLLRDWNLRRHYDSGIDTSKIAVNRIYIPSAGRAGDAECAN